MAYVDFGFGYRCYGNSASYSMRYVKKSKRFEFLQNAGSVSDPVPVVPTSDKLKNQILIQF